MKIRLTHEGRLDLEARLAALELERPRIADQIAVARDGGADPSENLDLRDAVDSLEQLESRIASLKATLAAAEPLEQPLTADGGVALGATVRVRHGDGEVADYRLVSAAEADPRRGKVSADSPIGRALLGRRPGDEVYAETPGGRESLSVLHVA
jgi:transcription elongation factor GreA